MNSHGWYHTSATQSGPNSGENVNKLQEKRKAGARKARAVVGKGEELWHEGGWVTLRIKEQKYPQIASHGRENSVPRETQEIELQAKTGKHIIILV